MLLKKDQPAGTPSFDLDSDEVDTVVDLICRGAMEARPDLTAGLLEVPITIRTRKAMKRIKRELGLTNIEVSGEIEIDEMSTKDETLLGRIDIVLKFLRQFGDERDYVAVECKRVGAGRKFSHLNSKYVTKGVVRFVNGQYAESHGWGFMLGYVLALPAKSVTSSVDKRLCKDYGTAAKLQAASGHMHALSIHENSLTQVSGTQIKIRHIMVDMTTAA